MKETLYTEKATFDIITLIIRRLFKYDKAFDVHFGKYCTRIYCENFDINIFWFEALQKTEIILRDVPDFLKNFIKNSL